MNKFLVGLIGLSLSTAARAEIFTVDTSHAEIGFAVKHMMVSNTKGRFTEFSGTIDYDIETGTLRSIEGAIEAASINTHNESRDAHLKNEDFFNVSVHPKITFKSGSIKKSGDNTFEVTGVLNVLGVDQEVTLPVTVTGPIDDPRGSKRIGLASTTVLNRRTLGITNSPAAMIGDEVRVTIDAEATWK